MMIAIYLVAGLALLIVGAEILVRGASRLAAAAGVSSLVIGLTIVAFGTSAPELAVSVKSVLDGQPDVAVGNVIGSNIFNVLFILGLSALIVPLSVSRKLIRLEVPLLILVSGVVLFFSLDYSISRPESFLLIVLLTLYLFFLFRKGSGPDNGQNTLQEAGQPLSPDVPDPGRTAGNAEADLSLTGLTETSASPQQTNDGWMRNMIFVVAGLALLVLGSDLLVDAAVSLARLMSVSEVVIGLTIVAAGTSLPEAVTSVVAAIRGERDIAVGNVVGSNLFNLLAVLGIAGMVAPAGLAVSASVVHFDLPVMIVVAFACLPIFFTGGVISRWEGMLLFGYYLAYTLYLILAASQRAALPAFSGILLWFIIPLTLLTLMVTVVREIRAKRFLPGS